MSGSLLIGKSGEIVVMLLCGLVGVGMGQHVVKPQRVEEGIDHVCL